MFTKRQLDIIIQLLRQANSPNDDEALEIAELRKLVADKLKEHESNNEQ